MDPFDDSPFFTSATVRKKEDHRTTKWPEANWNKRGLLRFPKPEY
ncbi:hypothetical protein J27TS7_18290 [Paenibacillus dendritiformis]|nr:hypothetical protein J27TS7_18290 [Paenibacillus dendritiformis]